MDRELARAIARARLALRVSIQTHKRTRKAATEAIKELGSALDALEEQSEALGIGLVLDNAEPRNEAERHGEPIRT